MEPSFSSVLTNKSFLVRALVVLVIAVIGTVITYSQVKSEWYESLTKPSWAPTGPIIAFIWTFLYCIYAWVWYQAHDAAPEGQKTAVDMMMAAGMVLNLLWVVAFFNQHMLSVAFGVLLAMIALTGYQIYHLFYKLQLTSSGVLLSLLMVWLVTVFFISLGTKEPEIVPMKIPVSQSVDPESLD